MYLSLKSSHISSCTLSRHLNVELWSKMERVPAAKIIILVHTFAQHAGSFRYSESLWSFLGHFQGPSLTHLEYSRWVWQLRCLKVNR